MSTSSDIKDLQRRVTALEAAIRPQPVPNPPPSPPPAPTPNPQPAPAPGPRPTWGVPPGMTKLIDQDPSDSQKPWKLPPGADHVEIWFEATPANGWNAEWWGYVQAGLANWNKSPALDCRATQGSVPAGKNKVVMKVNDGGGDDGNFDPGSEAGGFTSGVGLIQVSKSLKGGERKNVVIHEMGHAVGLAHRKAHVLMNGDTYSDIFDADPDEYKNLLFLYGRQRAS